MRRTAAALLASLVLLVPAACGDDDDAAPAPPPATDAGSDATPTTAAPSEPGPLALERVATLTQPVSLAVRPGSPDLFVVEQTGDVRRIEVAADGAHRLDPQPWLSVAGDLTVSYEQGFLGIAFSPDGQRVYVAFTNGAADQQLDEYRVEAGSAVASSRRTVLVIEDFAPNHNGGQLAFGRDGFLYWGMGDGGSSDDPERTGQDPSDLLGSILRIDVASTDGARPYRIPPDNPFADGRAGAPEVWAYGLRNPWRFSFDAATNDLWIGDVGQRGFEEIDLVPGGDAAGVNFGWSAFEGASPYLGDPGGPASPTPPVFEYPLDDGNCAVIAGHVYRGTALTGLDGWFSYADNCAGRIYLLRATGNGGVEQRDSGIDVPSPTSFGLGADGALYVLSLEGGVFRFADADPAAEPASAGGLEVPDLPDDPVALAAVLASSETAVRDPATPAGDRARAAVTQQLAYRLLSRREGWDEVVIANVPPAIGEAVRLNVAARRELLALTPTLQDNLPAWRIVAPPPAEELLGYYREAEVATGVGWQYLAAIHLVETVMGRIRGVSTAGAQGPMQFIPSTWAAYGEGDIESARDSIFAAARYLAHNGITEGNVDGAIWAYNHSDHYVRAVRAYADLMAADAAAYHGFHGWQVVYRTTLGEFLLPVGYESAERLPVDACTVCLPLPA